MRVKHDCEDERYDAGDGRVGRRVAASPTGIGSRNESSLHAALKEYLARPGDRFEETVDGFVVDIVRDGQLVEIQTKNFYAVRRKLEKLVERHPLTLVYPVARAKWIVKVAKRTGRELGRRRSPRRGDVVDLFNELLSIPALINHPNFSLEVVMVDLEEVRCADGKGSWRRKGMSIVDRKLLRVADRHRFERKDDFLGLLPAELGRPFTTKMLATALGVPRYRALRMTYCLRKMGALAVAGKERNAFLFEVANKSKGSELPEGCIAADRKTDSDNA